MTLRVGILGGTFDPVHDAHLAIARLALEQLELDQILWIPTGRPGYREPAVAPAAHRVAMLRLALAGEARYAIDERELGANASGFSYDTIKSLREERPGAGFFLLMGADQYAKRAEWHRWADIEKLCQVAVVARPGSRLEASARTLRMAPLPISASEIRTRLGHGEDVTALLPAPVLDYIRRHGLYR